MSSRCLALRLAKLPSHRRGNLHKLFTQNFVQSSKLFKTNGAIAAGSLNIQTRGLKSSCIHNYCGQENLKDDAAAESHQFQAETRMLLDIVARSLYSEKEVFIRELVSNASDAIEKARYMSVQGEGEVFGADELKIVISTDKYAKTLTIHDNGIGMTKEELISNLGTIARSGSKAFINEMKGKASSDVSSIIGQFGVGFYSAFMVSDKVEVLTRSRNEDATSYKWSSDGCGSYTVEEVEGVEPGTKIVCHLKVEDREYSDDATLKKVLEKYSSFIGSPIELNGELVNKMQPLWMMDPKEITEQQHIDFYRFIGGSYDTPRYTLHYRTDAPINLRTLLYFPEAKPGLFDLTQNTQNNTGVALYCRKVLINNKAESVVPKWLRFVKGVVDSEDIPLNLSREMLQNSTILKRVQTVLENRCIRFLGQKLKKSPTEYLKFFEDYGIFLKEGVISVPEQSTKEEIGRLLVFESSSRPEGERVSLAEHANATSGREIHYLAAPNRKLAEKSPYYESLKKQGIDVLFCYENYDEVVLMQLREINGKALVSAEKSMRTDSKETYDATSGSLSSDEASSLISFLKTTLSGKCWSVVTTNKLETHPCAVTVEDMASARHFVRTQFSQMPENARYSLLQPQLEINPSHPLILKLNDLRTSDPDLANLLSQQLFANALITAELTNDPLSLVANITELLEKALCKPADEKIDA